MTIPTDAKDLHSEVARTWKRQLDTVARACQEARDNIDVEHLKLAAAYGHVVQLLARTQQMVDAGLTSEVVGPVIADIYGVDWAALESDWIALRDTELPALRDALKAHETEIVRGHLKPGGVTCDVPLSQSARDEIVAALDAVLARFA